MEQCQTHNQNSQTVGGIIKSMALKTYLHRNKKKISNQYRINKIITQQKKGNANLNAMYISTYDL